MNSKQSLATLIAISMFPVYAYAETEQTGNGQSPLIGIFWTIVPIILAGIVVWWFFGRFVRKQQTRSENYLADQKQHNERVEQLLERIAKAVERKETDVR